MSNENANHSDEKRSLKDEFDESASPEDIDDSKVKFLNGKQGLDETCVVEVAGSDVSFTGLGKEELMKYANDPFWVRTRLIMLIIFWVGWVAMLVAAVVIIVLAPKCPERPSLKWYQTDVVYQINPKSFKDSQMADKDGNLPTGAGVGDLEGIASKIDYFQTLGVNALWINSFYKSGDNSYEFHDVVDFKQVDEHVGTMASFESLRKRLKKKGMRMILDFIPNHTGKKHEWFMKSQQREDGFEDFYIWADGTGTGGKNPPNNWMTVYDTPAWSYDPTRGQWYYHTYLPEYPDLNLRNEEVLKNLDSVLRFWLDKGVDGFTIQGVQHLIEANTTDDEVSKGENTLDQPENLKLVKRWRNIINSYSNKPGREKALFGDVVKSGNNTDEYYTAGIHVVMSHALADIDPSACDQKCLMDHLISATSVGQPRGWMFGNGNSNRFGSLVPPTLQKAWQVLQLLLPGTPFVYYGDEIAMTNGIVSADQTRDPLASLQGQKSRDPYRTPMLWTAGNNSGFCVKEATPWLPINSDYMSNSVEYNSAHLVGYTMLTSFKDLVSLRSKEAFQFGNIDINVLSDDILFFTRKAKGFPSYLVAINRGAKTAGFTSVAEKFTLRYDSSGSSNVGKTFDTSMSPIGFSDGEVYVFEF